MSRLNKERRLHAQKVDILCNDLIEAQRSFIKNLDAVSFAANFYESIVGQTCLNNLLNETCELIKNEIIDASVAFFLRQNGKFAMHLFESEQPITLDKQKLENCFTEELVDNICRSNEICTLERMLEMGLSGNPSYLSKISAVAVPLVQQGSAIGFILIYRSSENQLTWQHLKNIAAIIPGLSRAIHACQIQPSTN